MCHICLLKHECYLPFSLLFYLTLSTLLKTSSGYLQMGRCLGEQTAGGAVGREGNEMGLLFASLGSPGCARTERAGEEGRDAARAAAGCLPPALLELWLKGLAGAGGWFSFPPCPTQATLCSLKPLFFPNASRAILSLPWPQLWSHHVLCGVMLSSQHGHLTFFTTRYGLLN